MLKILAALLFLVPSLAWADNLSFPNIAAMEAVTDPAVGLVANVAGYTQPNDGGGGTFTVVRGSLISANCTGGDGGTTFQAASSQGGCLTDRYWKRSIGDYVTPEDFGGQSSVTTDQASYWNKAISYAENNLGTCALFGGGPYYISSLTPISTDFTCLQFNNTEIVPYAASSTILTLSASHVTFIGMPYVNNSGTAKTSVVGMVVGPANPASTTNSIQNFNTFGMGCWDLTDCIDFKPGPRYSGADSEQYWNNVNFWSRDTLRTIWLANASDNIGGGANNNIFSGTIYQTGGTVNAGVQIDEGQHNDFKFLSCNGVNGGTSPLSTPSCFRVAANAAGGQTNSDNIIEDIRTESDTCDINSDTSFLSVLSNGPATNCGTAHPAVNLATNGSNANPVAIPGFGYQANSQISAYPNAMSVVNSIYGLWIETGGLQLWTPTTVSSLPTCNAANKGLIEAVTDANSPSYNSTLTGGSTTYTLALCNGSSWVAH